MLEQGDKNRMTITEIIDKLHMLQFFNQRAGRELWQSKPKEVQDKYVENADKYLSEAIKAVEENAENVTVDTVEQPEVEESEEETTEETVEETAEELCDDEETESEE